MTTKKLLFFGAILFALIGYIYKVQIPSEETKREAKLWLGGAVPREIAEITLKRQDTSLVLKNSAPVKYSADEKKGDVSINVDSWRLADLPDAKLDAGAVNSLINTLTNLNLETPIASDERESDLSIYGLDKPLIEVTINGQTLLVGKQSEYSGIRYLKTSASNDIYTAASFAYDSLDKSASDLRDRSPISFADSDIQSFTIQTKDTVVTVESTGENEWRVAVPVAAKASSSAVTEYLNQVRGIKIKDFFDGANKKEVAKDLSIVLTYKDVKAHPKPLAITISKDQLSIEGDNSSYGTEGDKVSLLTKNVNDLREKKFVTIDTEKVKELKAEFSDGEKYTLTNKDGAWKVDETEADAAFVGDLLMSLSELEASDFATQNERPLVEPADLKIITQDKTLIISKVLDYQDKKVRFATFGEDPEVYIIDEGKYRRISKRKEVLIKSTEKEKAN